MPSTPADLDARIDELARDTARLARTHATDERTLAALERIGDRWLSPQISAVVAGEVSTGKSELINALVGQRMLPSSFEALSSTWVRLHHAAAVTAEAVVQERDRIVTVHDVEGALDMYLTVDGAERLARCHGHDARVISADIGLPAPLLAQGLDLLDTPGAGGLQLAHRHSALAGLDQADALIFVTKPGEPISASERSFLAEAVDRVTACILVMTHRDQTANPDRALRADLALLANPDQWQRLVGDRERATRLAERFASVPAVSVSATDRLTALDLAEGSTRDLLEKGSNIAELEELVRHDIVERAGSIHRRNVVGLCHLLVEDIGQVTTNLSDLLTGKAEAADDLAERDRALQRWTEHGGDYWQIRFNAAVSSLDRELTSFARQRSSDLDREYRTSFDDMSAAEIQMATDALGDAPGAALAEMVGIGHDAIEGAVAEVRGLLSKDGLDGPLAMLKATQDIEGKLRPTEHAVDGPVVGPSEINAALQGGIGAAGFSAVVVPALTQAGWLAVGTAVPVFWPFVAGAAVFGGLEWWRRRRQRTADRAVDHLDTVRREIETTVVAMASAASAAAVDTVRGEIEAGLAELAAEVQRDREAMGEAGRLADDPEARAARLAELADITAHAAALRSTAETLLADLE